MYSHVTEMFIGFVESVHLPDRIVSFSQGLPRVGLQLIPAMIGQLPNELWCPPATNSIFVITKHTCY